MLDTPRQAINSLLQIVSRQHAPVVVGGIVQKDASRLTTRGVPNDDATGWVRRVVVYAENLERFRIDPGVVHGPVHQEDGMVRRDLVQDGFWRFTGGKQCVVPLSAAKPFAVRDAGEAVLQNLQHFVDIVRQEIALKRFLYPGIRRVIMSIVDSRHQHPALQIVNDRLIVRKSFHFCIAANCLYFAVADRDGACPAVIFVDRVNLRVDVDRIRRVCD